LECTLGKVIDGEVEGREDCKHSGLPRTFRCQCVSCCRDGVSVAGNGITVEREETRNSSKENPPLDL
jgi:hypothetical protein